MLIMHKIGRLVIVSEVKQSREARWVMAALEAAIQSKKATLRLLLWMAGSSPAMT